MLTFTSPDWPCLFDGCMIYDSHVYSSPFSYLMHPPVARPIMNHHATWSGTYYSFALDEPCAHFLVYHLYLTCLYLPFAPENCIYKFADLVHSPHLTSHSLHPILHHITSQSYCLCLLHHTWRQSLTPRSHPQSHIGFMLRSPAPLILGISH